MREDRGEGLNRALRRHPLDIHPTRCQTPARLFNEFGAIQQARMRPLRQNRIGFNDVVKCFFLRQRPSAVAIFHIPALILEHARDGAIRVMPPNFF